MDLPAKLATTRNGVSFAACLRQCAGNKELVSQYDRLKGTNLSLRGTGLDLAIDQASGRLESDIAGFVEFVWDVVFLRFGWADDGTCQLAQVC